MWTVYHATYLVKLYWSTLIPNTLSYKLQNFVESRTGNINLEKNLQQPPIMHFATVHTNVYNI